MALAEWERALVRALNDPLPIEAEPFDTAARAAGVPVEQALERLRAWLNDGTIRRIGARVRHQKVGYTANGMSVWNVPRERADAAAEIMCERNEVSHCYLRPTMQGWPYSLFAMIHGRSEEEVRAVAAEIAREAGIDEYDVLFSTEEYKKSAPRFFE